MLLRVLHGWHSLWGMKATVGVHTNLESPHRTASLGTAQGSRKDLSVPESECRRPAPVWLLQESLHPGPNRERIGPGQTRAGVGAGAHPLVADDGRPLPTRLRRGSAERR